MTNIYEWKYDVSLYTSKQLAALTNILNDGYDISYIENPKYADNQIIALGDSLALGIDTSIFTNLDKLPGTGIIKLVNSNYEKHPRIITYLNSNRDLKTMTWILSWIDTPHEKQLKNLLGWDLNWLQLEDLSKIYMKYVENNKNYINPGILLKKRLSFDIIEGIQYVYDNYNYDLSKDLESYSIEDLKNLIIAIKMGVPTSIIINPSITKENIERVSETYQVLVDYYNAEDVTKLLSKLQHGNYDNIKKATKQLLFVSKVHSKIKFMFKNLNKGIPTKIVNNCS